MQSATTPNNKKVIDVITAAEYYTLWRAAKIVSDYDQKVPQSQTHGIVRKRHTTITRHQEDKQSKAASSLSSPLRWLQN